MNLPSHSLPLPFPVTRLSYDSHVTHQHGVDGATVQSPVSAVLMGADCLPEGARIDGEMTPRSGDAQVGAGWLYTTL